MSKYKVVLIGAAHCGKTSIVNRYINGQFVANTTTTTQAAYYEKHVQTFGIDCFLNIWDTAGQERFHALTTMFYRDSYGALVVFDLTDSNSFAVCKRCVNELRQIVGDECKAVLIGNKSDLASQRTVAFEDAKKYAESQNMEYYETSAKYGSGIEQAFVNLAKKIVEGNKKRSREASQIGRGKRRGTAQFTEPPPIKESGCC